MTSVHGRTLFSHWIRGCARSTVSHGVLRGIHLQSVQESRILYPNHSIQLRRLSSKTSSSNSAMVAQAVETQLKKQPTSETTLAATSDSESYLPTDKRATTTHRYVPVFSNKDIREVDEETRARIHQVSSEIATAQSGSLVDPKHVWRRKEILVMEEEEYADSFILKERPVLLDRLGEGEDYFFRTFDKKADQAHVDQLVFLQQEIDLRPKNLRKMSAKKRLMMEIASQEYNAQRNRILGNDLAAAHFIVFRKGKVKFMGQSEWVTRYRIDNADNLEEEDLPIMKKELCTLPIRYDPRYRLEAIDASGVSLHYEGLANFENLTHVKWLSLRESPHIDDFCLERLARMFHETLEYIDLSGCPRISDRGIGVLHRCRKLKYICVENLSHLENLEIVCAMLEDHNPNLQVLGIDYEAKREQLIKEGEKLERMALLEKDMEQLTPIDDFKLKHNPDLMTVLGLELPKDLEVKDDKLLEGKSHKLLDAPDNKSSSA